MSNSNLLSVIQNGVEAVNTLVTQVSELLVGEQLTSLSGRIDTLASSVTARLATLTSSIDSHVPSGFFSVYMSSDQATAGTTVVIRYTQKEYDENTWFNSTTFRFQPTSSGYYYVHNQIWGDAQALAYIGMNSSYIAYGSWTRASSTTQGISVASKVVPMNGTTDYIEFIGLATATIFSTRPGSYALGYKLGRAP